MPERKAKQIKQLSEMARTVMRHHFGKPVRKIEFKPEGKTNFVFEVRCNKEDYIVRIGRSPEKLPDFLKEQWATRKAREAGVPAPVILEVGTGIIPNPYMLQKKSEGIPSMDHPQRLDILRQLGHYARMIHTVSTTGFGTVFNWSDNFLSKQKTWKDYLDSELKVAERINFLKKESFLPGKKLKLLTEYIDKIKKWRTAPVLNHCDLRLKNVIVNKEGKIQCILDWESCSSNIAPYWDLSIALHDLSIDGKQSFLEGYAPNLKEFTRKAYAMTVFNILNYVPTLQILLKEKNKLQLALYRLRLSGEVDLFSL